MSPRLAALSRSGRYVAIRQRDGLTVLDVLGTDPRRAITLEHIIDFTYVGASLWVLTGAALHRFAMGSGEELGVTPLVVEHGRLLPDPGDTGHTALCLGYRRLLLSADKDAVTSEDITDIAPSSAFVTLLGGRRLLIAHQHTMEIRDVGNEPMVQAKLPYAGHAVAACYMLDRKAIGMLMEGEGEQGDTFVTLRPNGPVIHQVPLGKTQLCAIADARGLALVQVPAENRLLAVDLRYGSMIASMVPEAPVSEVAVSGDGKYVVLAGYARRDRALKADGDPAAQSASRDDIERHLYVHHEPFTSLFQPQDMLRRGTKRAASAQSQPGERGKTLVSVEVEPSVDAAAVAEPAKPIEPEPEPEPIVIPEGVLGGLGSIAALELELELEPAEPVDGSFEMYDSGNEHLEDLLALATMRAYAAIARGWNSGRLTSVSAGLLPYEGEVLAILGIVDQDLAPNHQKRASEQLRMAVRTLLGRTQMSMQFGIQLPFLEVADEAGLSYVARQILVLVIAPSLRGEIARLYGVLANDENRPICDRYLIDQILVGVEPETNTHITRADIASELQPGAPLLKYGLIRQTEAVNGLHQFTVLRADPVLLSRLRGDQLGGTGPAEITHIRYSERALENLHVPKVLKRDLVQALLRAPSDGRPLRVVLRGRTGAGRRTLAATLAARNSKPLACIDCERMPRHGWHFAEALRDELRRAGLRGAIPCISGLEIFDSNDAEGIEHVRAVFRNHPSPLFIRTSPEFQLPLDPGYLSFTLPPLSETERLEVWHDALERRRLPTAGSDQLASRFRIGPGTIENIIASVEARLSSEGGAGSLTAPIAVPEDFIDQLDRAARQHIQVRMSKVATHITRLADWNQVALPDDVRDSIREFIGRVRHRRTVYESWGFDQRMSTSRGLTALFYGPPGTGKSMVAGLIARELGLDLYRVDLARVTSKWIGETEKNLAEVFDAAEDGQAVILFDEADSLFAKRTEVKSSVDRYANLEVNYLLQRLDTFEGIAILTTNMEGSVDNAFKRRMSLRLAFPFPDEDMRVRLWAAHIPPEVPTAGDFDFAELAKRFPMSGGYIRNSALRAAFLAAQENTPLTHNHLERAIHLEYREMGKLAPGGRME